MIGAFEQYLAKQLADLCTELAGQSPLFSTIVTLTGTLAPSAGELKKKEFGLCIKAGKLQVLAGGQEQIGMAEATSDELRCRCRVECRFLGPEKGEVASISNGNGITVEPNLAFSRFDLLLLTVLTELQGKYFPAPDFEGATTAGVKAAGGGVQAELGWQDIAIGEIVFDPSVAPRPVWSFSLEAVLTFKLGGRQLDGGRITSIASSVGTAPVVTTYAPLELYGLDCFKDLADGFIRELAGRGVTTLLTVRELADADFSSLLSQSPLATDRDREVMTNLREIAKVRESFANWSQEPPFKAEFLAIDLKSLLTGGQSRFTLSEQAVLALLVHPAAMLIRSAKQEEIKVGNLLEVEAEHVV